MPALFRHALMAAALALPAASFVAPFAAQPAAAQSLMVLHDAARQHDAALQAAQAQLQAARAIRNSRSVRPPAGAARFP